MQDSLASNQEYALSLHNPLDSLFAQYRMAREEVEKIAAFVDGAKGMNYFFEAAAISGNRYAVNSASVFQIEPAIKAMDAEYWHKAMLLTDVLEYMPAEKRNEWNKQIQEHKTPEFEKESVKSTLIQMLNSRARFMAERVDGLFKALSGSHVTNMPQAFGKRFIMDCMLSYGRISYQRANYIHDLRCVIGKFLNRDVPNSNCTTNDLESMARDGKWNDFDGGAFRVRLYLKGTIHMEINPELAWQLNKVLAFLYPMAIPPEFRTKPAKKSKEHKLHHNLVSFEVMKDLERGLPYHYSEIGRCSVLSFAHGEPPLSPTIEIMEQIGGVQTAKNVWSFDYKVNEVLKEISRSGMVPEYKSHQYYPTPANVAQAAMVLANEGATDEMIWAEPSAGQGGLADYMTKDRTTCVEISALHCEILKAKGFKVIQGDFIELAGTLGKFDRIVMNPPFSSGRWQEHTTKAIGLLNSKGVCVSILPTSARNSFRPSGVNVTWSKDFDNEFNGTSISVVIMKAEKV